MNLPSKYFMFIVLHQEGKFNKTHRLTVTVGRFYIKFT